MSARVHKRGRRRKTTSVRRCHTPPPSPPGTGRHQALHLLLLQAAPRGCAGLLCTDLLRGTGASCELLRQRHEADMSCRFTPMSPDGAPRLQHPRYRCASWAVWATWLWAPCSLWHSMCPLIRSPHALRLHVHTGVQRSPRPSCACVHR